MSPYSQRVCPSCGQKSVRPEVHSETRGEAQTLAGLAPFWSGLFKEKVFFTYARCERCDLLFCPQYFTGEQLSQLYANLEPNMNLVPPATITATQLGYWNTVAGQVQPGDYLELGPDIGHIVAPAVKSGKFQHYWLFEPNAAVHGALADATCGKPHTISASMDDFSAVPDGSVSLAVMIHVLDHLLDPLATLRAIRATLRPGATLLIVTHNEKSLLRVLMGKRWPPFCLQHPEIYNPGSITKLLVTAGFSNPVVARSTNHFPVDFMVRQAAYSVGVKLDRVPLPKVSLGLKLGNILTMATA